MSNSVGEFRPLYSIKVASATKNGETLEFQIQTSRINDGESDTSLVARVFEDFAWFLHCLQSQDNVISVIFPPLPPRPITSLSASEKLAKKQVSSSPGVLVGDDFASVCQVYQEFLTLCANHPRLGHSPVLEKFLMEKEAPARVRVRRNIFDSLKKTYDDKRTSVFKDSDGDLQQTRINNDENMKLLKSAASSYSKIVNNTHRISAAYAEIQAALKQLTIMSTNSKEQAAYNQWCDKVGEACDYASSLHRESAVRAKRSLGSTLHLYEGYSRSQHDMLQKRVYKAQDLESAIRSYEKATKPSKKQQAEDEMRRLEGELKDMTAQAKPELERHNRQRIRAWQSALLKLTESEIKSSRAALAKFTESHEELSNYN